ncbi:MAG: hypothetical protein MN733_10715 [Nitrososphaera sp.]|nr:hypothetical protein [Nitrososphaera sp.]
MELRNQAESRLRENILEAQVVAFFQGHELGVFEPTDDGRGYQAVCRQCGKSVYASDRTLYSILEEKCPGSLVANMG